MTEPYRKAVTRFQCPPHYFDVDGNQWELKECVMEYITHAADLGFGSGHVVTGIEKNLIVTPNRNSTIGKFKTPEKGFYCGITMTMDLDETHYFLGVYLGDGDINKHVFKIVEETKYLDDKEKEPYPGFTDYGCTIYDRIALSTYTDHQLEIELTRRNSKVKAERYHCCDTSAKDKLREIKDLLNGY